ncbi:biotin/lipoyl-binding carrier protein [Georhizobium sp. MAB10]|uniref:biotin/lipoyl-binding carrier protein n=1 Tax=Georhizobium sp. MAB10 TaxID=3028319 RepID=UPI003855B586
MALIEVKTEITGNVWKILVEAGQSVAEDDPIMILESMKMEIPVSAPEDGVVTEIQVDEGTTVTEGTVVALMKA